MRLADPDSAQVHVPPPLIYVAAFLAGWLLSRLRPLGWHLDRGTMSLLEILGVGLMAAGSCLGAWSMFRFLRSGTSPIPVRPTTAVVTEGPYRFTRNPMYLGLTLVLFGLGIVIDNGWVLLTTPLAVLGVDRLAIAREEAYLERKFGAAYVDYKSRVRRWI